MVFPIVQLHLLTVPNYCVVNIISRSSTSQRKPIYYTYSFRSK